LSAITDPALQTLVQPFEQGLLSFPAAPARAAFLRARAGIDANSLDSSRLDCDQSFKPWADELERAGMHLAPQWDASYPLVLVLPPRQREEARATLARAVQLAGPDGVVVSCQHNDEGARTMLSDLTALTGAGVRNLSKSHCRVAWSVPGERQIDQALLSQWLKLDAPRAILDGRVQSRPGLFAWDRIDPASALLAQSLPKDLKGVGADLGAGYGYLSHAILSAYPQVTGFDIYEAELRALDLARINLAPWAETRPLHFEWHDVCAGLPRQYDFLVSNPPFHQGRADQPLIGAGFIRAAAKALRPGGRFFMVANQHLPYEGVMQSSFASVRPVIVAKGFKVLEGSQRSEKRAGAR